MCGQSSLFFKGIERKRKCDRERKTNIEACDKENERRGEAKSKRKNKEAKG